MAHIVLIDEEPGTANGVVRGLSALGHEVVTVSDAQAGLWAALGEQVELVVLDLMPPPGAGREVLDELARRRPGLPVIVATARDGVEHRVECLNAGAVDYVAKPFALAELDARIRAHLRTARLASPTIVRRSGIEIDLVTRSVRANGATVRLTSTEFALLAYLMSHPGDVLGRRQILREVWGYPHDPATNIVEVYIGYLRRKLGGYRASPIKTVRARGYRFVETEPLAPDRHTPAVGVV